MYHTQESIYLKSGLREGQDIEDQRLEKSTFKNFL